MSGISAEYRSKVHSYTTTYQQGTFFGDYCNLAMNLILQWPNDGTTELVYGKLPGGVYEGNTEVCTYSHCPCLHFLEIVMFIHSYRFNSSLHADLVQVN